MPLMKDSLKQQLEDTFNSNLSSPPEAAAHWAKAYVSYAGSAISKAGSLPTNAQANLGILIGVFTSAFNSMAPVTAAALISQGVISFWQTILWAGPTAAGITIVPGNLSLIPSLIAVFMDLSKKSKSEKATALADAFDSGAKMVVVSDIPYVQPAPPIVGPIS